MSGGLDLTKEALCNTGTKVKRQAKVPGISIQVVHRGCEEEVKKNYTGVKGPFQNMEIKTQTTFLLRFSPNPSSLLIKMVSQQRFPGRRDFLGAYQCNYTSWDAWSSN